MQEGLDDLLNTLSRMLPERMQKIASACKKSFFSPPSDASSAHQSALSSLFNYPRRPSQKHDSRTPSHSSSLDKRLSAYTIIQELSDSVSLLPYAFTFFFTQHDVYRVFTETTMTLISTLEDHLSRIPAVDRPYVPFSHPERESSHPCASGYPSQAVMISFQKDITASFWKILDALPSEARLPPADEHVRVEAVNAFILKATDLMASAYAQPVLYAPPRKLVGGMRMLIHNLSVLLGWYVSPIQSAYTASPHDQHHPPALPSSKNTPASFKKHDPLTEPLGMEDLLEGFTQPTGKAYAAWLARHEAMNLQELPKPLTPLAEAYLSFLHEPTSLPPIILLQLGRLKPAKMLYIPGAGNQLVSLRDRLAEDLEPLRSFVPSHTYDLLFTTALILNLAASSPSLAEDLTHTLRGKKTSSFILQETYPQFTAYQLPA